MILPRKTDDPVVRLDSPGNFHAFLRASRSEKELLYLVLDQFRHGRRSQQSLRMTPQVRAIITDALTYLTRDELIQQIVSNVDDRLDWPDYVQWCRSQMSTWSERT